jgi:6,7-dimethyl-8-ribityllumazine synthase
MRNADRGEAARLDGRDLHIGIVQARFNRAITDRIATACKVELDALGVAADRVALVRVPGALEIGVALAALAASDEFDALIAIGCVIRGETYHFELVANESGAAVTRVGLDHSLPIANAVLTCETEAQAEARADDKGATPPRSRSRWRTCWTTGRERRARSPAEAPEAARHGPARRQPRGDGRRRGGAVSARRKSREFALQGLYEWLIGGADAGVVDAHVREREGFEQCDAPTSTCCCTAASASAPSSTRSFRRTSTARPSSCRRSSTRCS